jgi:hypothetical protein
MFCPLLLLDQLIRNGNVELQSREEEIRFLNMQMTEDKRAIELLRKQVPQKQALEQEREILQMQVINKSRYSDCAFLSIRNNVLPSKMFDFLAGSNHV